MVVDRVPGEVGGGREAGRTEPRSDEVVCGRGQFEVDEAHPAVGTDYQVTRVEVSEDDAAGVNGAQPFLDLREDVQCLVPKALDRSGPGVGMNQGVALAEPSVQRLTGYVLLHRKWCSQAMW